MAIYRLIPGVGWVDVDFSGTRLVQDRWIQGAGGSLSVSPGLITETETLFDVAPGTITQSVGLIQETESLFNVTPAPGPISQAVGLITETELLFTVSPAASISISIGQIVEQETLFDVTPVPGAAQVAVALIQEIETLFGVTVDSNEPVLTGNFWAAAWFPTGQTDVVIALYDPITEASISLDSDKCTEVGATGLYRWSADNLEAQPTGYQEYVWTMTDGVTTMGGVIRMGDSDRLVRIEKLLRNRRETDPVTGQQRVYDDDGSTILFEGNIYEDIGGTTPYGSTSTGIDRADRMDDA